MSQLHTLVICYSMYMQNKTYLAKLARIIHRITCADLYTTRKALTGSVRVVVSRKCFL